MVSIWPPRWPGLTERDEVFVEVIRSFYVFAERSIVDPLADPVDRRQPVQAVVRSLPVLEVLPLVKAIVELGIFEIHRWPELLKSCLLDALGLSVEVR